MHPARSPRVSLAATLVLAFVAAAVLLAATGCSAGLPAEPKGGTITGKWQVDTVNGSQVPAGPKPLTAEFASDKVSGFAGVNTYNGPYVAGSDGAFKAGPVAATMMAGEPEAMQLESGYLEALQAATSYYAAGGRLVLYDKDGSEIVVYDTAK